MRPMAASWISWALSLFAAISGMELIFCLVHDDGVALNMGAAVAVAFGAGVETPARTCPLATERDTICSDETIAC